ncbi:MAG: T9SS type A sorting domain-containing protein [Candidatus Kapaibacterium sp.]
MKRLVILLLFVAATASAQIVHFDAINIMGKPLPINYIHVINQSKGLDTVLIDTDVLDLGLFTGAPESSAFVGGFAITPPRPNPFADVASFGIEAPESGRLHIEIADGMGRRVAAFDGFSEAGRQTYEFRAGGLPAGMYLIRATLNERLATQKMIKYTTGGAGSGSIGQISSASPQIVSGLPDIYTFIGWAGPNPPDTIKNFMIDEVREYDVEFAIPTEKPWPWTKARIEFAGLRYSVTWIRYLTGIYSEGGTHEGNLKNTIIFSFPTGGEYKILDEEPIGSVYRFLEVCDIYKYKKNHCINSTDPDEFSLCSDSLYVEKSDDENPYTKKTETNTKRCEMYIDTLHKIIYDLRIETKICSNSFNVKELDPQYLYYANSYVIEFKDAIPYHINNEGNLEIICEGEVLHKGLFFEFDDIHYTTIFSHEKKDETYTEEKLEFTDDAFLRITLSK